MVFEINEKTAGAARNLGLKHANGHWILFMDDDDWFLHEYCFTILADKLKQTETDILAFSFITKGVGYSRCGPWIAIWNKAWRNNFIKIHNFKFPLWDHADDVGWAETVHDKATWTLWDMPLYYYNYMRPGSIADRTAKGEWDV